MIIVRIHVGVDDGETEAASEELLVYCTEQRRGRDACAAADAVRAIRVVNCAVVLLVFDGEHLENLVEGFKSTLRRR